MNPTNLFRFFQLQRQIFGVCPHTGRIFRLSDCHIYIKKKPEADWMQKIEAIQARIDRASERLDAKENQIRESARQGGRKEAMRSVRKIDPIFTPLKINPDDSKALFHPIDFIVFNGMKAGKLKNVLLMDKVRKSTADKRLQKSIDNVIEQEKYEWITLRVKEDGIITQE